MYLGPGLPGPGHCALKAKNTSLHCLFWYRDLHMPGPSTHSLILAHTHCLISPLRHRSEDAHAYRSKKQYWCLLVQPISADMRFRNQESGIGNPESGSVSGLFGYSAIQKRPGTANPDSRFLIPESRVCGNGLYHANLKKFQFQL